MWFEERMLPWVKMSSRKRQFLKDGVEEKMLPQGEDGFMEKMVHGVKMGAWMKLRKG
jgi:hypothetical protein